MPTLTQPRLLLYKNFAQAQVADKKQTVALVFFEDERPLS